MLTITFGVAMQVTFRTRTATCGRSPGTPRGKSGIREVTQFGRPDKDYSRNSVSLTNGGDPLLVAYIMMGFPTQRVRRFRETSSSVHARVVSRGRRS